MGNYHTKRNSNASDKVGRLKKKARRLEAEINEIMCKRENENQVFEREMMVFAIQRAEWSKERRRLEGEVKELRKKLKKGFKGMNNGRVMNDKKGGNQELQQLLRSSLLVDQIMEDQALRDEVVDKWKELYFAVKIELDHLIHRINQGQRVCWTEDEEDAVENLQKKLAEKEEIIEQLQARLASLNQQGFKKEREVDILRQSLRIITHYNSPKNLQLLLKLAPAKHS